MDSRKQDRVEERGAETGGRRERRGSSGKERKRTQGEKGKCRKFPFLSFPHCNLLDIFTE